MIETFNPTHVDAENVYDVGSLGCPSTAEAYYFYARASEDLTEGDVCVLSDVGTALRASNASAEVGHRLGVCVADASMGAYTWLQIGGTATFNVAAGTVPSNELSLSATPGMVYHGDANDILTNIFAQSVNGTKASGLIFFPLCIPQSQAGQTGVTLAQIASWARAGSTALIPTTRVGPAGTYANLNVYITDAIIRLAELEHFEDGLRHLETVVSPVSVRIAFADFSQYHIGSAQMPAPSTDAEMTITIATEGTHRFDLTSLAAKPAVFPATILSASNSIGFILNGTQYYLARLTSGQLVLGADSVGTRNVSITLTRLPPLIPRPIQGNKVVATNESGTAIIYEDKLDEAGVRTQVAAAIVAGTNITITPSGSGASQQLTIAARGSGGGNSQVLEVLSDIPTITGYSVGDIINVEGDLYELVDDEDNPNLITGTSALHDTNYYGDTTFSWQAVDPFNMRLNLSKSGVGSSPSRKDLWAVYDPDGRVLAHYTRKSKWC